MKHSTTKGLIGLLAAATLGLATATAAELPIVPMLPAPAKPDGKDVGNLQTYMNVGEAMCKAMVGLLKNRTGDHR